VLVVVAVVAAVGACRQRGTPHPNPLPASRGEGIGGERREGDDGRLALTDEAGRRVVPRAVPARRIVSLAPNVTELLFAIGAGDQVVGVDNYSDAPAGPVARLPKVGSNYEPSLERIVSLKPDVVITAQSANRMETVSALERLKVPVFVTDTRAITQMDRTLRNLGTLAGRAAQAEQQLATLRAGLADVRRRAAGQHRPRVLVVVWDDPLFVAGRDTFTNDLIEIAGGTNVAADAVGFAKYPLERVLRSAPEVIILPTHSAPEQGPRAVGYWSRWPDLPAVRAHRVHAVEDALISRPGARLVAGAELLLGFMKPLK
jgi:iron complex transport system substrate-binding protein